MNELGDLVTSLDGIPHGADENDVLDLIRSWRSETELGYIRRGIFQWLSEPTVIDQLRRSARETSTHYVWPLVACSNGYSLVINEFKNPRDMAVGYATSLHNHRYSFASFVLSGGYAQERSTVELDESGRAVLIRKIGQDDLRCGTMAAVNYKDFHRLTRVSFHTMTLLAKCPASQESSISVDVESLRVSTHVPVEARILEFKNALISTLDRESSEGDSVVRLA